MTANTHPSQARTALIGFIALLVLLATMTLGILALQPNDTRPTTTDATQVSGVQVGSGDRPPSDAISLLPGGRGIQVGSGDLPPSSAISLLPSDEGIQVGSGDLPPTDPSHN